VHDRSSTWEWESLHFTAALSGRNSRGSSAAQGTLEHTTRYSMRELCFLFFFSFFLSFFFSLYHNVVEEGSRTFVHPISRISLYLLFRYLRTCSYCCLIPVLSVPYAGNSPFSSLHEGDVGTDREINLGLLSRYDLCFALIRTIIRLYLFFYVYTYISARAYVRGVCVCACVCVCVCLRVRARVFIYLLFLSYMYMCIYKLKIRHTLVAVRDNK